MSMLRSLQNTPGVITVFHSSKSPASTKILHLLEKNKTSLKNAPPKSGSKLSNLFSKISSGLKPEEGSKYKYFIDINETNVPTPEQYQFIKATLSTHPICKQAFKQAFPKWGESLNLVSDEISLPRTSEYNRVTEGKTLTDLIDEGIFQAPLVVDWDNKLISSDKSTTEKLLTNYSGKNTSDD